MIEQSSARLERQDELERPLIGIIERRQPHGPEAATELRRVIKAAGGIRLIDSTGEGHIPLHCVTTDIGQALDDTELILSPLPATANTTA